MKAGFRLAHSSRAVVRRFAAILITATLLLSSQPVRAQQEEALCRDDVIIMTLRESDNERLQALRAIDRVSRDEVVIADELKYAAVFELGNGSDGAVVSYQEGNQICTRLKRDRREAMAEYRDGGRLDVEAARRYRCSCDGIISLNLTPNDPSYGSLWGMHNSNDVDIDAPEAWNLSTGSSSTIVAVIDTGIDYNHPDLRDNMWRNPFETPGNGIDDDNNGYIDDIYGIDALNHDSDPMDDHFHGSHCAGTIAGRGNNGAGVVGVNWNAKLIALKFLGANGGYTSGAIEALDYVTELKKKGLNIVLSSNSWGGGGYSVALYDSIKRSNDQNMIFVAAAGNSAVNNDSNPHYPSSYNLPGIVSVAAMDSSGGMSSFSNYGFTSVDIGAPGRDILSAGLGGQYRYASGTSMATPHVSGILALAFSANPSLSVAQAINLLYSNAVAMPSLQGKVATGAMANAFNLLLQVGSPPPGWTPPPTATPLPTSTPTAPPTPTSTPTPSWHNISGKVDHNGTGLAGAKVQLFAGSQVINTIYSDASGNFTFTSVEAPKRYTIKVSLAGYNFSLAEVYHVGPSTVNFSAGAAQYRLRVLVINGQKQPLPGIEIDAGILGVFNTGSDGSVEIYVPIGFNYSLTPNSADYDFDYAHKQGAIYGNVTRAFRGLRR